MYLRLLSLTMAAAIAAISPAIAFAGEVSPAERAWLNAVSRRLQSEGFKVQATRIDARVLTLDATFRGQNDAPPAQMLTAPPKPAGGR